MTDEARFYRPFGKLFADHQSVAHARDEYVRNGVGEIVGPHFIDIKAVRAGQQS
jgi:hypothetical protein